MRTPSLDDTRGLAFRSQQQCYAAVTCTAAGREQAPHDTQQGPPVWSAGDVQDAGLACLALPADPCPCCPPKHLRLPWFVVQPCVGGSHCQVILQGGAPLGDPLAILCRARIGQWAGTLAISDTGRAFSHHISLSTVPLGAKRGGAQLRRVLIPSRRLVLQRYQLAPGGVPALYSVFLPLVPPQAVSRTSSDKARESSIRGSSSGRGGFDDGIAARQGSTHGLEAFPVLGRQRQNGSLRSLSP